MLMSSVPEVVAAPDAVDRPVARVLCLWDRDLDNPLLVLVASVRTDNSLCGFR